MSMKFPLLIRTKMLKNKDISPFQTLRCCIYFSVNVKLPNIIDILMFMSNSINIMLISVGHKKSWERSGSVVECLTRDQEAVGLSLTGVAVCRAHRGLPVGFLLLRYSVLFTVESLSLLYLLVIP